MTTPNTPYEWVDALLITAIRHQASDLHVEPLPNALQIRLRIAGELSLLHTLPKQYQAEILSRIKILAQLDIAEQRLPQDGQFTHHDCDCRVSSYPTLYGEKIVIRLLGTQKNLRTLHTLGLTDQQKSEFIQALNSLQGFILVTGPTGSGKTTTLYAVLHYLNELNLNIMTVEDPVEMRLPGIHQLSIQPAAQLTFARALRAILRQDPDVIFIGEIRDEETADIACKAALSGHLVLSTLHTGSIAETPHRLLQMGVSPYALASALTFIVSQRLIRETPSKQRAVFDCLTITDSYQEAIENNLPISQFKKLRT